MEAQVSSSPMSMGDDYTDMHKKRAKAKNFHLDGMPKPPKRIKVTSQNESVHTAIATEWNSI